MKPLMPYNQLYLEKIAKELCSPDSANFSLGYASKSNTPMPSLEDLEEFVSRMREVIFPGYYGPARVYLESLQFHTAANLDSIYRILKEQIARGICFICAEADTSRGNCHGQANAKAVAFTNMIPHIRDLIASDVKAAFYGDPAAQSPGETIFCYPSIKAMMHHRIAHALYALEVPLIPRIISEMSHSVTGIDIHPGAHIGAEFFIDHGTGVVIGETSIIGNRCRLYQGVTLGALSFTKGDDGTLVKGEPRHPILEDDVTVYAGATVLGRITLGAGSIIGGNVWLTQSVPPNSRIVQQRSSKMADGEKITSTE